VKDRDVTWDYSENERSSLYPVPRGLFRTEPLSDTELKESETDVGTHAHQGDRVKYDDSQPVTVESSDEPQGGMLQPGDREDLELKSERKDDLDLNKAMPPLENQISVDMPKKGLTPCHDAVSSSIEGKYRPKHTKEGKAAKPVPDMEIEVKRTVEAMWLRHKNAVSRRFVMNYVSLETKKKFLGMRFHLDRQRGMVHFEQYALIMKMLMHFNLQDCDTSVLSPFLNPMPTKADIPEKKKELTNMQEFTDSHVRKNHSSCELELMALDKGATMGMFLRWLTETLGGVIVTPVPIFVDNQGAISLANPVGLKWEIQK
jgi:hypothetical protein